MKRILKVLILSVALAVAAFIALFVAAYLRPKSNRIAPWRVNLEQIWEAKQVWASSRVGTTNDAPTLDDLRPYLSDWVTNHFSWTNSEIVDSNGGVYTIGRVGELPSCLIGGRRVYP
jgi:hypothetical protein